MFRSIFEKIPSIITKTDVSSPHRLCTARTVNQIQRSHSCANTESTKSKDICSPNLCREHKNKLCTEDQRENSYIDKRNTKFYKNKFKTENSYGKQKKHQSRYNLQSDNYVYFHTEKYELNTVTSRNNLGNLPSHHVFGLDKNNNENTVALIHLQPGNLKPFQQFQDNNYHLSDIKCPNVVLNRKYLTENVELPSSDVSIKLDTLRSTSSCLNLTLANKNLSNTIIPRPSFSEYVCSTRSAKECGASYKLLHANTDNDVVQKRTLSTIRCNKRDYCNTASEKVNPSVSETVSEQDKKDNVENAKTSPECLTPKHTPNTNPVKKTNAKVSLPRLKFIEKRPMPCYSDYVKSKRSDIPSMHAIEPSPEVQDKLEHLASAPQRHLLLQNIFNKTAMQKREYSNIANRKCITDETSLNSSHGKYSIDSHVNRATYSGIHGLSKSADGLYSSSYKYSFAPIFNSRGYVMYPSYSDYIKKKNTSNTKHANIQEKQPLLTNVPISSDIVQKCSMSTLPVQKSKKLQTMDAISSLNAALFKRNLGTKKINISKSVDKLDLSNINGRAIRPDHILHRVMSLSSKKSKKCKPKPDPCEKKEKPTKCFLPSKVRLAPVVKCGVKPKPCPVPPKCVRADDCLCIRPKTLPPIEAPACVCVEPYVPSKAPKLKRLKFDAPDPPRKICHVTYCPIYRADDDLVQQPKSLQVLKPKPCDCVEPPPMIDVPLIRLKRICEPEPVCYPPKPCPPPPPCVRADDNLVHLPKQLPALSAPICPCIEEKVKDAPPLKRLNLKYPEPPRVCPKPCICDVDCPRADDDLVQKVKPLPRIVPGDCPCVETEMVDVNYKRLNCIEDEPEECFYTDPCDVAQPRADFGCWEYYVPETKPVCPETVKIRTQKKKTKKVKFPRC